MNKKKVQNNNLFEIKIIYNIINVFFLMVEYDCVIYV